MKVRGYKVQIDALSEDDGGGYLATLPELPGCSSDGASELEALAGLPEAIDSWVAMAGKLGRKVPQPQRTYA